jgi:hypothetical protein
VELIQLKNYILSNTTWLIFGLVLGSVLLVYARSYGVKRERKILAIALVIAAMIYVTFAIIWGDGKWVLIEVLGVAIYGVFVWAAIRYSAYWLAVGWLLHPLWDVVLHLLGSGKLVAPAWYAISCITFDILIAAYIFNRVKYWQQSNNNLLGIE